MEDQTLLYSADIVVIFVLLFFTMLGYLRGLAAELMSILGWIAGVGIAVFGFPYLVKILSSSFQSNLAANVASGLIIFVATLYTLMKIRTSVANIIVRGNLNAADKLFGGIFGLLKGFLLLLIAYMAVLIIFPDPQEMPKYIKHAYSRPTFDSAAIYAMDYLPSLEDLRHGIRKNANEDSQKDLFEAPRHNEDINLPKTIRKYNDRVPAPVYHYDPDPMINQREFKPAPLFEENSLPDTDPEPLFPEEEIKDFQEDYIYDNTITDDDLPPGSFNEAPYEEKY